MTLAQLLLMGGFMVAVNHPKGPYGVLNARQLVLLGRFVWLSVLHPIALCFPHPSLFLLLQLVCQERKACAYMTELHNGSLSKGFHDGCLEVPGKGMTLPAKQKVRDSGLWAILSSTHVPARQTKQLNVADAPKPIAF